MSDHSPTPEEPTFLPPRPMPATPAPSASYVPPAPASSAAAGAAANNVSKRLIIVILVVLLLVIAALLIFNWSGGTSSSAGLSTPAATVSPSNPVATATPGNTVATASQSASMATATQIPPNANADQSGILATPNAPATAPLLIVFQDYQCPWCALFDKSFASVVGKAESSGKVRVEYRTMIFLDQMLSNDASMRAGIAAACSDGAGVYQAYHDAIYANQPASEGAGYSDDLLRNQLPAQLGVTGDRLAAFQQCYDTKATQAFVQGTNDKALAAGITGTPTYVLNNQVITNQIVNASTGQPDPALFGQLLGVS